jgi:hypothetical protein
LFLAVSEDISGFSILVRATIALVIVVENAVGALKNVNAVSS